MVANLRRGSKRLRLLARRPGPSALEKLSHSKWQHSAGDRAHRAEAGVRLASRRRSFRPRVARALSHCHANSPMAPIRIGLSSDESPAAVSRFPSSKANWAGGALSTQRPASFLRVSLCTSPCPPWLLYFSRFLRRCDRLKRSPYSG